ncbi:MAG: hypothetical protein NT062_15930 [Proteobacteria bacterium]|nr:hypothetical protein [Pseudomonadota bacterium]
MGKFARTEADEKRFAAGYPFLFTLADGEASESAAIAMKIRDALDPITTTTWNREVATHYVLGLAGGKPGAIDARRAATILAKLCATTQISYGWHGTNAVLILEQLVGTPPVIEAVLRFFETTPVKRWDVGATVNEIAYALGFLLLRTPATKRKAYVRRMQTLVAKGRPSESFAAEFLDFASGGTAAVEPTTSPCCARSSPARRRIRGCSMRVTPTSPVTWCSRRSRRGCTASRSGARRSSTPSSRRSLRRRRPRSSRSSPTSTVRRP